MPEQKEVSRGRPVSLAGPSPPNPIQNASLMGQSSQLLPAGRGRRAGSRRDLKQGLCSISACQGEVMTHDFF